MSALLLPYCYVSALLFLFVVWVGHLKKRLAKATACLGYLINLTEKKAHRNPEMRLVMTRTYAQALHKWLNNKWGGL